MRPVCLLVRTKNLRQSDGLHFISDSLNFAHQKYTSSLESSGSPGEKYPSMHILQVLCQQHRQFRQKALQQFLYLSLSQRSLHSCSRATNSTMRSRTASIFQGLQYVICLRSLSHIIFLLIQLPFPVYLQLLLFLYQSTPPQLNVSLYLLNFLCNQPDIQYYALCKLDCL